MTAWRDAAICLSLAYLCYLRIWSELLIITALDRFILGRSPSQAHYLSAWLNTLLLGGVLWLLVTSLRRRRSGGLPKLARWAFLPLGLVILNAVRGVIAYEAPGFRLPALIRVLGPAGAIILCALMGVVSVAVVLRFHGRLTRAACTLLLLLSPLVIAHMIRAICAAAGQSTVAAASWRPRTAMNGPAPGRRVVWVILDEWDQRLSFDSRPTGVRLPEMDRFREKSFWAAAAQPPGGSTLVSMPALTTGLPVMDAKARGANELQLAVNGLRQPVIWDAQSTIFPEAQELGFRSAVVGWYIPYCRLFGDVLASCSSWEMGWRYNVHGSEPSEILFNQLRSLVETNAHSLFGRSLYTLQHIRIYREHLERSKAVAADARLGLVLLHFPIPHAPFFFDRTTSGFTLRNYSPADYSSALVLADRTLGELLRAIEEAGVADRTTILLTSDHSYRAADLVDGKKDPRVPFLLKLAGQSRSFAYSEPFNTLVSKDLILAILRDEIHVPEEVSAWLHSHRFNSLKEKEVSAESLRQETNRCSERR